MRNIFRVAYVLILAGASVSIMYVLRDTSLTTGTKTFLLFFNVYMIADVIGRLDSSAKERHEEQVMAILRVLDDNGDLYGLDIVKHLNGLVGRHAIYVILAEMVERGLVQSRPVGMVYRRLFSITEKGRDVQKSHDYEGRV